MPQPHVVRPLSLSIVSYRNSAREGDLAAELKMSSKLVREILHKFRRDKLIRGKLIDQYAIQSNHPSSCIGWVEDEYLMNWLCYVCMDNGIGRSKWKRMC
jgi:hypothetical protein